MLVLFFLGIFYGYNIVDAQNPALKTFLQSSGLKYASVGIQITELETGKNICSHNANMALTPASTLKLITTASALELLGEKYLYKTSLFVDGKVNAQGVLNGNVYIQGAGDPTLGSEYLWTNRELFLKDWLSALQKTGVTSIQGAVVVVDDLYGYEGVSAKWLWEDIGNYFAPGVYGISIFDNTYRLSLKSGVTGTQPEIIGMDPVVRDLKFENHLTAASNSLDSAYIYGIPFSNDRRIYGTIPQHKSDFVIKGDIPDPGLFLADYFTLYLQKNGIDVLGKPTTSRMQLATVVPQQKVVTTVSKSIAEIIRVINVRSNNHYAEHLFYTIGKENNPENGHYIPVSSVAAIKQYWTSKGMEMRGLTMYDGCGLSPLNAVSASLLTDLLVYMHGKSENKTSFYGSLPEAGKEGTVRSFLQQPEVTGSKVKSGSISGVQSYAGYLKKGGKYYAFAIIVNHFTGNRATLRNQIEKLLLTFE